MHADHLKRPELMTNASKTIVWKAVYAPFGTASSITGAAANQMRFPGQWFQLEAGLHYNWWRRYDPTLGRYTQADPLADGRPEATQGATTIIPNGGPGASLLAAATPAATGPQRGLTGGLATLVSAQQNPIGLETDFASAHVRAALASPIRWSGLNVSALSA